MLICLKVNVLMLMFIINFRLYLARVTKFYGKAEPVIGFHCREVYLVHEN
jgi:hypothetical protein